MSDTSPPPIGFRETVQRAQRTAFLLWIGFFVGLATLVALVLRPPFAAPGLYGVFALVVITLPFLAGASLRAYGRLGHPERDPDVKSALEHAGISFDELAARVDRERAGEHLTLGTVEVLASWLYRCQAIGMDLVPIDKIAWVHKQLTKQSMNLIPIRQVYSIVVYTVAGQYSGVPFEFHAPALMVDGFMSALAARVPWAVLGYDEKFEAAWRKDQATAAAPIIARRDRILGDRIPGKPVA